MRSRDGSKVGGSTARVLSGEVEGELIGLHGVELKVKGEAQQLARGFERFVAEGTGRPETVLWKDGPGSRFYARSMRGEGLWMAWENVNGTGEGEVYLQLKGEAWELYGQGLLSAWVNSLWGQVLEVVRLDVAFDGVPFGPGDWFDAFKSGEWRGAPVDYLDNTRGRAAWVGKLYAGSSQVCVYDERGPVRLEFRTRKRDMARVLLEGHLTRGRGELARLTLGAVRGHCGGAWGKLDAWLGTGEVVRGEAVIVDPDAPGRVDLAARTIVLHGLRNGFDAAALELARAAKRLDSSTLDRLRIDWHTVGPMWGRVGPEGVDERVEEVAAVLREVGCVES
jgi:hypothetical protein